MANGKGQSEFVRTARNVFAVLIIAGSLWLVGDNGIGETWDVVTGDQANIETSTNTTYGGAVNFDDRVLTATAVTSILVGFGAVSVSRSNPKVFNDFIKYAPILAGIVGLISFSGIVSDMVSQTYDFNIYSDGQNALHLYIVGSVGAMAATFLGMRGGN